MPDTKLGHETLQKTRANFYKGASVGFRVLQDKWDFTGKPSVTIQKAYLSEISLTNHPAHVTTLSLREIPMPDFTKQKIRLYRLMLPIL
jgi:phage head maturation protease